MTPGLRAWLTLRGSIASKNVLARRGGAQVTNSYEVIPARFLNRPLSKPDMQRCIEMHVIATCRSRSLVTNSWRSPVFVLKADRATLAARQTHADGYPPVRAFASDTRHVEHACALTSSHICGMVFHMKTTLNIDDTVMARLRRESARSGRTMSELVETALRQLLQRRAAVPDLSPLPTFDSGGALVDVADRDALYRVMEER